MEAYNRRLAEAIKYNKAAENLRMFTEIKKSSK